MSGFFFFYERFPTPGESEGKLGIIFVTISYVSCLFSFANPICSKEIPPAHIFQPVVRRIHHQPVALLPHLQPSLLKIWTPFMTSRDLSHKAANRVNFSILRYLFQQNQFLIVSRSLGQSYIWMDPKVAAILTADCLVGILFLQTVYRRMCSLEEDRLSRLKMRTLRRLKMNFPVAMTNSAVDLWLSCAQGSTSQHLVNLDPVVRYSIFVVLLVSLFLCFIYFGA